MELVDGAGVEVEGRCRSTDLAAGGRDRLSGVGRLENGEPFLVTPDQVGDIAQHIAPLPDRGPAPIPFVVSVPSDGHRAVDIAGSGAGHGPDLHAGGRVEDRRLAAGAGPR